MDVDELSWEVVEEELGQLMTSVSRVNSTYQLVSTLQYRLASLHHHLNDVRLITHCKAPE